ncbi:MAG: elongation factor Ts, partial [Nitrospirae bacterium]|nr:elongation factor Ts [Nitrospirota bacterium]
DVIDREKEIYKDQVKGKPANVVDKIIEGKLEKFYSEKCLLRQAFVKNPDQTVSDLVVEMIAKLGENILVRRFVRYQLGEKQDES